MTTASSSSQSPSLPPSSPSPPVRYFDLLPPELISHTLSYIDSRTRRHAKERLATLYSLCLTSKVLRSFAQPLLLDYVDTSLGQKEEPLELLAVNNTLEALASVRSLRLHFEDSGEEITLGWVDKVIQSATNLQEVSIDLDFSAVRCVGHTSITTLSLCDILFGETSQYIVLPELTNLSLFDCSIAAKDVLSVPKLKHLAFFPPGLAMLPEEERFLEQFASTLISLSTSANLLPTLPSSLFSSPLSILAQTHCSNLVPTHLHRIDSVRIVLINDATYRDPGEHALTSEKLDEWTNLISSSKHALKTIYFVIPARVGGVKSVYHPALRESVEVLVAACQKQKLQIVWEEGCEDRETFHEIVPSLFIEHSEARRAVLRGS